MADLSSKQFFKLLEKNDLIPNQGEFIIVEEIMMDSGLPKTEITHMTNVTFKEVLCIRDYPSEFGLVFENCVFEKGIDIDGFRVASYDSNINKSHHNIVFKSCKGLLVSVNNGTELLKGISIEENSEFGKIEIRDCILLNEEFVIKDSKINDQIIVSKVHFGKFNIENSTIDARLKIENSKFNSMYFYKTTFNKDVQHWNNDLLQSISLVKNIFNDFQKIVACTCKKISSKSEEYKREFEIEPTDIINKKVGHIKEIHIAESNYYEGLVLKGLNETIDKLNVVFSPLLKGKINFDNSKITEVSLSGLNQNSDVIFDSIKFKKLNIYDFTNRAGLSFINCKGDCESAFNLISSDLGQTSFNGFLFSSFNSINIKTSTISKIGLDNITWFEDYQLNNNADNINSSDYYRKQREIYRQIKQALLSSGNKIESLRFQARELSNYSKEIKKSHKLTFGDRIIFIVNKTNDYGLNWIRPFKIIISVTFLYYLLFLPMFSDVLDYKFNWNFDSIRVTLLEVWGNLGIMAQMLNPVRNIDKVYGENIPGIIFFADYIHRIILGILIYQLIRAFRKFSFK